MRRLVTFTLLAFGWATAPANAGAWQWPVRGPLLERFHTGRDPFARGQHRDIDIAAPAGSGVSSACAGRVRFAGAAGTSGRTVSVVCGGLVASYLHLRSIAVREGDSVRVGSRLGAVGTSGRRRLPEPHLHFGVRVHGERWRYLDPLALLGEPSPPAASPLLPAVRRAPGPLGRAPRPGVPRPAPAVVRPVTVASPRVDTSPHGTALPWTAWVGIGLVALGLPAGGLGALRRRRRSVRSRVRATRRPAPARR